MSVASYQSMICNAATQIVVDRSNPSAENTTVAEVAKVLSVALNKSKEEISTDINQRIREIMSYGS